MARSRSGLLGSHLPCEQDGGQTFRRGARKRVRTANGDLVGGEQSESRGISCNMGRWAGNAHSDKVSDGSRGAGDVRGIDLLL